MRWFRRKPKVDDRDFEVQLHMAQLIGERWLITYSWHPMTVRGEAEARRIAQRLRQDNLWASKSTRPQVTVTELEPPA